MGGGEVFKRTHQTPSGSATGHFLSVQAELSSVLEAYILA